MKKISLLLRFGILLVALTCARETVANVPGGGTGTGPNVTLVDNGDGTVTMANGIISILISKTGATVNQINYTFNNNGSTQTLNVLAGGNSGGQLYWEFGGFSSGSATYSVVANTSDYCEVGLLFNSASSGQVDVHFSMVRGSTGFYVTPIWIHRSTDSAMSLGECRDNIYSGSIFNWMSVDATRNQLMEVSGGSSVGVQGAPAECSLWTNGIYAGRYEDKYKYSADYGVLRAWGWSSVGTGGKNIGLWDVPASFEYMASGPMRRELTSHIGTTILNTPKGAHYGFTSDASWAAGEVWAKVCGPHFIYCNAITNTITATNAAAQALYADALAQADAETSAWPYSWFTNSYYAPASGRGAVKGQIVINDAYNPNASASNLWVGVEQQPNPGSTSTYDFQKWYKPYHFWVKTDADGNFIIPDVIAGANYTLYAFGPGAAGTFQSQNQTGGNAPNELNIPTPQFSVTVTGGVTNDLGAVTWTPTRVGPTVFEIGYPDRTGAKFRHGDDWWVGDIGPSPTNPMPVWTKFLEYPFDFPSDVSYTVGSSRWTTDWNYCQPVVVDDAGIYNGSTSTINFNLASAPGATASLYLALSSDFQGPLIIKVNGTDIAGNTGYFPAYSSSSDGSDATIREGIHGMFSDNRITFSGGLLHAGANTITINMRKGGNFANHAMYDYIRLELTGYIPPAPASVNAYAGNNCNLVSWPVTPGAVSYNVVRTNLTDALTVTTNSVVGPVCGSGLNNAVYFDTNVVNGSIYNYTVQSVNTIGSSTNSPPSSSVSPSLLISSSPPAAPASVTIGSATHHSVTVNWAASVGANFYTVSRSTLFDNGGGASNVLGTIVLANNVTGTTYTDTAPTDGSTYSYFVTATSAGGTSANSASAAARPLPSPPANSPGSLTGEFIGVNVVLNWSAVSGAVGYIIRRGTNGPGPFTYVQNITPTTFTDSGLNVGTTYYYQVTAVNAAGVSAASAVTVIPPPLAPISLSAFPGNAQVVLSWTAVPGVNGYYLYSGTESGNETNVVLANYSGTSYTNTGLINGTTYYYVVSSTNSSGESPYSPEASATPDLNIVFTPRSLTWNGDGAANIWDASGNTNWRTNTVNTIFNNGDIVTFDNSGSNNVPVTIAGTPKPALVTFNPSKSYTIQGPGSIAGTNKLVKTGSGTLIINNTNIYSGGTIISNSTVAPGNIGANSAGWGTGAITLAGGTIQFNGYGTRDSGSGWGGCTNTFNVPAGLTGTLLLPARFGYASPFNSPLTGSGTLNVTVEYVRDYFTGDWSAFTGKINVSAPTSGYYANTLSDFRINNTAGYANAAIYLNNNVNCYVIGHNNLTVDIGELGGGTTAYIGGDGSSSNPTWRIGAKNTTNTYAGVIADAGGAYTASLIKTGTGMLVLSGANTYSGGTTVSGGTLMVNTTLSSGTGSGAVTVTSGGILSGTGIISGAVSVNSGGSLAPGNLAIGTLTFSNALTLKTGSTNIFEIRKSPLTNDVAKVSGALTNGGNLVVTNLGGSALAAGDSFPLFQAASYAGSFSTFTLPPLGANLAWNTNSFLTNGTLTVMSTAPPSFGSITELADGNFRLNFSGPTGRNYELRATTNLALVPVTLWTLLGTGTFGGSPVIFDDLSATNYPQRFYQIRVP